MLIRLVGLVTIEHDGTAPQHLSSAQAQVAFARLILRRTSGTSRDQLADTVWPEGLPDTWASALRSVVSRVRAYVTDPQQKPGGTPLIAQSGRRVLAVDVRGRGRSDRAPDPMTYQPATYAQDILALLQQTGIERAVFLGTSMGGIITAKL